MSLKIKVYDRSMLILDNLFEPGKKPPRPKPRLELARYQYLLPRLYPGCGTHLERQRGGTANPWWCRREGNRNSIKGISGKNIGLAPRTKPCKKNRKNREIHKRKGKKRHSQVSLSRT